MPAHAAVTAPQTYMRPYGGGTQGLPARSAQLCPEDALCIESPCVVSVRPESCSEHGLLQLITTMRMHPQSRDDVVDASSSDGPMWVSAAGWNAFSMADCFETLTVTGSTAPWRETSCRRDTCYHSAMR